MDLFLDLRFHKQGRSSIWVDQRLDGEPLLSLVADPDLLFDRPECQIIKDQRKIKVGRIALEIQGEHRSIYLKRYNAFSWRYRFASLFCSSGAVRSLRGAAILSQARIATARPIAAMESRLWGMLNRSFFFSEEIKEGQTADTYWREKLSTLPGVPGFRRRREFLKKLAQLFRSLHEQHVYHNDLKDANILVAPGSREGSEFVYLLDLEGIRRYRNLNRRRRTKNLVQLNRTFGRYLGSTEKLRFLKFYLGASFSNRRQKRRWVRRILEQSRRWDRQRLPKK